MPPDKKCTFQYLNLEVLVSIMYSLSGACSFKLVWRWRVLPCNHVWRLKKYWKIIYLCITGPDGKALYALLMCAFCCDAQCAISWSKIFCAVVHTCIMRKTCMETLQMGWIIEIKWEIESFKTLYNLTLILLF